MKKFLFTTILIHLLLPIVKAQDNNVVFFCDFGTGNITETACNNVLSENILLPNFANDFGDNNEAIEAIEKILNTMSLPMNFEVRECQDIKNARAMTTKEYVRYIFYNNNFMNDVNFNSSYMTCLSILSHEIGHHFSNHTNKASTTKSEQRNKELEADIFSGSVMYNLGASLDQAKVAVKMISNEEDDSKKTHPKLSKRLNAIEKGYNNAKSLHDKINNTYSQKPSAESFYNNGNTQMSNDKLDLALNSFTDAIQLNPQYANAYLNRGIAKYTSGDFAGAIEDFTTAINLNPESIDAYYDRGLAYYELGEYNKSIRDFNRALIIDSKFSYAYVGLGNVKLDFKNYREAIEDFSKAINLNSTYIYALYNRGRARYYLEDYIEANQDFEKTIALSVRDVTITVDSYIFLGNIHHMQLDYSRAIVEYDKAINLNEKNALAYYNRGLAKVEIKDYEGSCLDFEISCNLGYIEACSKYDCPPK